MFTGMTTDRTTEGPGSRTEARLVYRWGYTVVLTVIYIQSHLWIFCKLVKVTIFSKVSTNILQGIFAKNREQIFGRKIAKANFFLVTLLPTYSTGQIRPA
jgi:hypothetical protein